MATKTITQELDLLKSKAQEGKVTIGIKSVLQGLRRKGIRKVFLASNCPPRLKQDVLHYAALAQVPVAEVPQNNEELGILCKKNFFIAVVGITGE